MDIFNYGRYNPHRIIRQEKIMPGHQGCHFNGSMLIMPYQITGIFLNI